VKSTKASRLKVIVNFESRHEFHFTQRLDMTDSDLLARLTKLFERWDRDGLPEPKAAKPSPEMCPCGKTRLNTITPLCGPTVKVCAPDDGVCERKAAKPVNLKKEGEEFVLRIPSTFQLDVLIAVGVAPVPGAYMPCWLIRKGECIEIPGELRCRLLQVV